MDTKVAVLGAGTWGTALAITLAGKGLDVRLWDRRADFVAELEEKRVSQVQLGSVKLDENIELHTDIKKCLEGMNVIVVAVASQAVRSVIESLGDAVKPNQIFVNVSKGVEIDTLCMMSDIVEATYPDNPFVALSGPSHAEEVAKKLPTTLVSASTSRETAEFIQDLFTTDYLRVYTNPDVIGVEICGSIKNVIALAAGISDGLGFGDNAKAAIITRGITEMARLGMAMGAKTETFAGLSGIGDLIVTCASMHSRNRRCGILIGEGMNTQEAIDSIGMVVEGIYTTKSGHQLAEKYGIEMPITNEVYKIIYEGCSAEKAVKSLMTRMRKHEMETLMEANGGWEA